MKQAQLNMIHVRLPSGGIAKVRRDVKPETLAALDQALRAAAAALKPRPSPKPQSEKVSQ